MPAPLLGVLGDLVEDVVCWLDEDVRPGTDTAARVFRRQGGSAANVAVMAARGCPVRFIGCTGDDPAGAFAAARLSACGIDVRLQRGSRTGTIVILVHPGGERDMLPDRGACAELTSVDPAWLAGLGALHLTAYSLLDGTTPAAALAAARAVRSSGGWVSLDVSSTGLIERCGLERFAALVADLAPEVVFANADEAAALGLDPDANDTGAPAGLSAPVRVVKRGSRPATVLFPSGRIDVAADPVEVLDSTGAGDAFAAGFLSAAVASGTMITDATAAQLHTWTEAAHRAAAVVLQSPGAGPADHH